MRLITMYAKDHLILVAIIFADFLPDLKDLSWRQFLLWIKAENHMPQVNTTVLSKARLQQLHLHNSLFRIGTDCIGSNQTVSL